MAHVRSVKGMYFGFRLEVRVRARVDDDGYNYVNNRVWLNFTSDITTTEIQMCVRERKKERLMEEEKQVYVTQS